MLLANSHISRKLSYHLIMCIESATITDSSWTDCFTSRIWAILHLFNLINRKEILRIYSVTMISLSWRIIMITASQSIMIYFFVSDSPLSEQNVAVAGLEATSAMCLNQSDLDMRRLVVHSRFYLLDSSSYSWSCPWLMHLSTFEDGPYGV